MAGGRPSSYDPKYCDMLIEHMNQGLSFESFAGLIGSTKQTIYSWTKNFEEFLDAKKHGEAKCRLFWERLGLDGVHGLIQNFNSGTWIFNMKNRFAWRDKLEIDETENREKRGQLKEIPKEKLRDLAKEGKRA